MNIDLNRLALAGAAKNVLPRTGLCDTSSTRNIAPVKWGEWLESKGLGAWWHAQLFENCPETALLDTDIATLRKAHQIAALSYMLQRKALASADKTLEAAGIRYVAIKGAHLREWLYDDAAVRTSADVDILVDPHDQIAAIKALQSASFDLSVLPEIGSHEVQLRSNGAEVDLHWDILRPGRTRVDVVSAILDRRERLNGIWVPSAEHAAFLMLAQPGFADHVSGPTMSLIRALDFYLLTQRAKVDWKEVIQLLDRCGVKTAAWATLQWFLLLNRDAVQLDPLVIDALAPGRLRAGYLRYWVEHDLPTRLNGVPGLCQLALTLPLHDTFADAMRAVWVGARARYLHDPALVALMSSGAPAVAAAPAKLPGDHL